MKADVHEMLPYAIARPAGGMSVQSGAALDGVVRATEARQERRQAAAEGSIVGECVDDRHPTLTGRVCVQWSDGADPVERWVPTLQGLSVRVADRVLLTQPVNFDEPIVTGVLDGFTRRPEPAREPAASLELKRDETVRVAGADGQTLIELYQDEAGPVVRLLETDVNLELPGAFRLKASRIELEAARESVDIQANDDVNVEGEMINLNC